VQDSFREILPQQLYNRPKKGFDIPLLDWLRNDLWPLINNDLLQDDFIMEQQIFNVSTLRNLKKQLHASDSGDSHETIWALIVFQFWWKKFINETA